MDGLVLARGDRSVEKRNPSGSRRSNSRRGAIGLGLIAGICAAADDVFGNVDQGSAHVHTMNAPAVCTGQARLSADTLATDANFTNGYGWAAAFGWGSPDYASLQYGNVALGECQHLRTVAQAMHDNGRDRPSVGLHIPTFGVHLVDDGHDRSEPADL